LKIRYRIFLGFTLILSLGFGFLIWWILNDVNVQPKKSMEEALVDTAHILAAHLEQEIDGSGISTAALERMFHNVGRRRFLAPIYELVKDRVTLQVYVTDRQGMVIFDSDGGKAVGENFYRWFDVKHTLAGRYGARTTRLDPADPASSVAYVAAPIYHRGEIVGACTVAKSWKSIHSFVRSTRNKIIIGAVVGFVVVLMLSYLISLWITRPILRLTDYAYSIKYGVRAPLPSLGRGEIGELGEAFEQMRETLAGEKYIENYVQILTHQLKGPLSSIRGAAELLQEELPDEDRAMFIRNIETESARIQRIVDRLLELVAIESRRQLYNVERIDAKEIMAELIDDMSAIFVKEQIICVNNSRDSLYFRGERFLIRQALRNLLQNAVEFTPAQGAIRVEAEKEGDNIYLRIRDTGTGIPGYALSRIFDKFYSLPRPGTSQKSSGLGLSLVKEVADLHHGDISLANAPDTGTIATLRLPTA
jgi:two-component system sensor histidine kinase CreC